VSRNTFVRAVVVPGSPDPGSVFVAECLRGAVCERLIWIVNLCAKNHFLDSGPAWYHAELPDPVTCLFK